MLNKKILMTGCAVLYLGVPITAYSQFGTGDDSIGQFLSENPDLKQVEEKHVDVPYAKGESIFRGRGDTPKLSYCIVHKDEKVKVKRSSMYSYKQETYSLLADQLYNCDKPDSKIMNELARKDFIHVLYYLNVKYKLDLKRA